MSHCASSSGCAALGTPLRHYRVFYARRASAEMKERCPSTVPRGGPRAEKSRAGFITDYNQYVISICYDFELGWSYADTRLSASPRGCFAQRSQCFPLATFRGIKVRGSNYKSRGGAVACFLKPQSFLLRASVPLPDKLVLRYWYWSVI